MIYIQRRQLLVTMMTVLGVLTLNNTGMCDLVTKDDLTRSPHPDAAVVDNPPLRHICVRHGTPTPLSPGCRADNDNARKINFQIRVCEELRQTLADHPERVEIKQRLEKWEALLIELKKHVKECKPSAAPKDRGEYLTQTLQHLRLEDERTKGSYRK